MSVRATIGKAQGYLQICHIYSPEVRYDNDMVQQEPSRSMYLAAC